MRPVLGHKPTGKTEGKRSRLWGSGSRRGHAEVVDTGGSGSGGLPTGPRPCGAGPVNGGLRRIAVEWGTDDQPTAWVT